MFTKLFILKHSNQNEESLSQELDLYNKTFLNKNEEEVNCLHCKKKFKKYKNNQFFCCNGCASVYQFLISNDLNKYYEIMNTVGQTPVTIEEYSCANYSIYQDEKLKTIFKFNDQTWGFFIPDVKCAACIWLIEKALQKEKNISDININLLEKTITFLNKKNDPYLLKNVAIILEKIGYHPLPLPFISSKQFRSNYEKERIKDIGISGFAFGNIMIFSACSYFGKYFGIDEKINYTFIVISMIISIPATLYAGRSFYINTYNSLKIKKIHIDVTISFALTISLVISIYKVFLNSSNVYFDTITGLIFLLLVGRYFHEKTLHKARELGESIKNILPLEAFSINKGDTLLVPSGGIFLADGIIIEGETEVNQASLTGEEFPVVKLINDKVIAGSQNILNPVKIIANKTGNETWIYTLENLINKAKNKKSNVENLIEKILPFFTLSIILISILSFLFWVFISWQKSIDVLVSILVISCPCALALATPLLMQATLKKLWSKGAIVKNQNTIETISAINTVIFDKTGTLTNGDLNIIGYEFKNNNLSDNDKNEIILSIVSLAKNSVHLVSKSIVKKFNSNNFIPIKIKEIKEYAGKGIEGIIEKNNIKVKLGNLKFISKNFVEMEERFCAYGLYDNYVVKFILSENIRKGAKELVNYLDSKNIKTLILSGDKILSVKKIAEKVGIKDENCYAELLPEDKLNILTKLQIENNIVMALGDGVNDAAMLAKAHVGIASHGGTDIALHSADIFIRKSDLSLIKKIFEICDQSKNTLKLLIIISLIYNLIAIIFAVLGFVDPIFAALFMPFSSVTVFLFVYFRNKVDV